MTNVSPWHVIDRCLACILMAMELVKILVMRPYTRPIIYIMYLACCGAAIFSFLKSQEAQKNLNADGFVFWHTSWHSYPIAGCMLHLLDNFLDRRLDEYYSLDCGSVAERDEYKESGTVTTRALFGDGKHSSSVTNLNALGVRRSRRIEEQKKMKR
jgi:hypothetical protein